MMDYYFTPQYLDARIAHARGRERDLDAIDPVQRAIELEGALDALCKHLGIVLIKDVRKRWVIVPAHREGAFVYEGS